MATIKDLQKAYKEELDIFDDEEEERFEQLKMYGSGACGVEYGRANWFIVSRREERVHRRRDGRKKVRLRVENSMVEMLMMATESKKVKGLLKKR